MTGIYLFSYDSDDTLFHSCLCSLFFFFFRARQISFFYSDKDFPYVVEDAGRRGDPRGGFYLFILWN